jgi:hypothetical protein
MVIADFDSDLRRAEEAPAQYPVNLRFTVPFIPNSIFVTLIVGKEKRGPECLREERARHPIQTWGNLATVAAASTVFGVATLFALLVLSSI